MVKSKALPKLRKEGSIEKVHLLDLAKNRQVFKKMYHELAIRHDELVDYVAKQMEKQRDRLSQ